MRLFLSSYRAGKYDKSLREFIGGIDKIAVVTNAKDYKTPEDRQLKIDENFDYFRTLGLEPEEIDLRPYFHKDGAAESLKKYNFVWLAGGNAFLLRRALRYTGLDIYLGDQARKNEVILGGESAGAIVMGPTLKYSEMEAEGHEDSPHIIPEGYDKEIIWEGLELVDYVPVPHYKSGDYAAEIDEYVKRLDEAGYRHKDMSDDQVIMINGDKEEFLK